MVPPPSPPSPALPTAPPTEGGGTNGGRDKSVDGSPRPRDASPPLAALPAAGPAAPSGILGEPLSAPALPLVLYDGACGLCSRLVQAILRRDPAGRFHFASLQSPLGQRLLAEAGLPTRDFDTLVLIDAKGAAQQRSDAALGILSGLPRWRWTAIGRAIPRPLRDAAYAWVARRRHRLFARPAACLMLPPEWRARFHD